MCVYFILYLSSPFSFSAQLAISRVVPIWAGPDKGLFLLNWIELNWIELNWQQQWQPLYLQFCFVASRNEVTCDNFIQEER